MESQLSELLRDRFQELGVGAKRLDWAEALEVNQSTLSRVLNGIMSLTRSRASEWSAALYKDDPVAAEAFAARMMAAAQSVPVGPAATAAAEQRPLGNNQSGLSWTVDRFCTAAIENGGWISAEDVPKLFAGLTPPAAIDPLVIIEYRDTPRAGPDARYEHLGAAVAKAVADGINVAMVVPFQTRESVHADTTSRARQSHATKYMIDVQDECVRAYVKFRNLAQANHDLSDDVLDQRLRLYFPGDDVPRTLNPGFQAKMFYIQYYDPDTSERHYRLFQWVSSPSQDILVYREKHVTAEALRDSFFPIPHLFEMSAETGSGKRRLPHMPSGEAGRRELGSQTPKIEMLWPNSGLPVGKLLWTTDHAVA